LVVLLVMAPPSQELEPPINPGRFNELSGSLRKSVLLIGDKQPSGTTVDDAEELAKYERLGRGTNGFSDFVANAIS